MTLTEKAAYLKGLRDGLNLSAETSEGKLLNAMIDLISEMALRVDDLDDTTTAISDELDDLEDEIEEIQDFLDGDLPFDFDDEDGEDEDDDPFPFPDEEECYELRCPNCDETIVVDEEALTTGFECPHCGAQLDFDIDDEDEDEDDEQGSF